MSMRRTRSFPPAAARAHQGIPAGQAPGVHAPRKPYRQPHSQHPRGACQGRLVGPHLPPRRSLRAQRTNCIVSQPYYCIAVIRTKRCRHGQRLLPAEYLPFGAFHSNGSNRCKTITGARGTKDCSGTSDAHPAATIASSSFAALDACSIVSRNSPRNSRTKSSRAPFMASAIMSGEEMTSPPRTMG